MVVKAKIANATATTSAPTLGRADANAAEVSAAPFSPPVQAPEVRITRPVMVQITMVSMKVPSMATMPCLTGFLVRAAACAIGALPRPASLEKMPRATP